MSINSLGEHSIKYLDVYNDLKTAILNGKYLRGSFLPTESDLTEMYNVSRTTVRKAVSLLQDEGLIRVQRGRGTEITSGKSQIMQSGFSQIYKDITDVSTKYLAEGEAVCMSSVVDIVKAEERVAKALCLPVGTLVYRVQRLKILGNVTFGYIISYIPMDLAPGLEKYSGQVFLLYSCMKNDYNIVSTHVEENISADTARFLESNLLGIPVGSPLLVAFRTTWHENGVMEYTEAYHRPDIYQLSITMHGDLSSHIGKGIELD